MPQVLAVHIYQPCHESLQNITPHKERTSNCCANGECVFETFSLRHGKDWDGVELIFSSTILLYTTEEEAELSR